MLEAVLVLAAAVADAFRPHWALLTEIALLRHQLAVLQRSVARPRVARFDRIVLVALATVTPTWRNVLRIVQPETRLRWHRAGFKALWRWRSRTQPASRLAAEAAALIRSMASANRLWSAERRLLRDLVRRALLGQSPDLLLPEIVPATWRTRPRAGE
jgi:hypothetical protein